jgi:hypothetical protein
VFGFSIMALKYAFIHHPNGPLTIVALVTSAIGLWFALSPFRKSHSVYSPPFKVGA